VMAGLLTHPMAVIPSHFLQIETVVSFTVSELTAAGTVQDFHLIPF